MRLCRRSTTTAVSTVELHPASLAAQVLAEDDNHVVAASRNSRLDPMLVPCLLDTGVVPPIS